MHDLSDGESRAQKVFAMLRGHRVYRGSVAELRTKPSYQLIQELRDAELELLLRRSRSHSLAYSRATSGDDLRAIRGDEVMKHAPPEYAPDEK
jgi:hypothetical protein